MAILCNHQRSVPKTHTVQMTKLQAELDTIQGELDALEKELEEVEKKGKKKGVDE